MSYQEADRMHSFIDALFRGEINPFANTDFRSPEYLTMSRQGNDLLDSLYERLDEDARRTMDDYLGAQAEIGDYEARAWFAEGFRLGACMQQDVLSCAAKRRD